MASRDFVVGVVVVVVSSLGLVGCEGSGSVEDTQNVSARPNPADYPDAVRQRFMRTCIRAAAEAAPAAPPTPNTSTEDGYAALGPWDPSDALYGANCKCNWEWITAHVPYRDFVEADLEIRTGVATGVPDWMTDAAVACSK